MVFRKRTKSWGEDMRRVIIFIMVAVLVMTLLSGCATPPREQAAEENKPPEPKRFEIIQEEQETRNIGGITVIRDNQTKQEFLVITGLNGAPAVIQIQ